MTDKIDSVRSLDENQRNDLEDLVKAAKKYQMSNGHIAGLHLFITCPKMGEHSRDQVDFQLFPVVSTLFHQALRSSNRGSMFSSQSLRDAFLIANYVTSMRQDTDQSCPDTATAPVSSTVLHNNASSVIPEWFPWEPSTETVVNPTPTRHSYILCRDEVMNSMMRCTAKVVADAYAEFFTDLWAKAYSLRLVSKQISYASLTPPWLREQVVFIYGPSLSVSIPFTRCSLPTKNQVRESGKKALACAILDTWMRREKPSTIHLANVLRGSGVRMPMESLIEGEEAGPNSDALHADHD